MKMNAFMNESNPKISSSEILGRELSEAVIMFHGAIAHRIGMSATEWKCLELLERTGPITAKRLAEMSGLTTGAITGIVDRLEKTGYVRRDENPEDRRSIIIQPLERPDLIEEITPIFSSLGQAMSNLAQNYTEKELQIIQDFFKNTVNILHDLTFKIKEETVKKTNFKNNQSHND